ncbi:MAG: CDP-alcohol phosphatidyltransferase family protein [Candidatus Hodarchaeales archaeon]
MGKKKTDYSLRNLTSKLIGGKPNEEKGGRYAFKKEGFTLRLHRHLSTQLVEAIDPFSFVTPNRITWFGFLLAVLSGVILAIAGNDIRWLLLASIIYWISAIMDCVDGQLARKRGISSKTGEWLDFVLEGGKGIFLWMAIGFNISSTKTELFGLNVWFLVSIVLGFLGFLSVISIYSSWLFEEVQPVSHDHVYMIMLVMTFHLLEPALLLFTIALIFAVFYTLIEKTFVFASEESENGEIK